MPPRCSVLNGGSSSFDLTAKFETGDPTKITRDEGMREDDEPAASHSKRLACVWTMRKTLEETRKWKDPRGPEFLPRILSNVGGSNGKENEEANTNKTSRGTVD